MAYSGMVAIWLAISMFYAGEAALARNAELSVIGKSVEPKVSTKRIHLPVDDKNQVANDSSVSFVAFDNDARSNSLPDLAYGAYQRGYYLTALKYALPRALQGDSAAQTLVAELYEKGLGVKRDGKEATHWYELAARNGSREAKLSYALRLLEGKYVAKNEEEAQELLRQSAEAGSPLAQFNYAQLIIARRPTSKGSQIALGYYEKAAAMGVADAYFAMAKIYSRGVGARGSDKKKARLLLVKAAKGGIIDAQIELAIWLANGYGGDRDLKIALIWFKKAASHGNVIAQNRLARMLAFGVGTTVKPVQAAKWYLLAHQRGHKDAMLDDFFSGLPRNIREEAFEAANLWSSGSQGFNLNPG